MDHHLRILQQRIQAIAVAAHDPLHRAARRGRAQNLKRAGDEIVQREEEKLHADHNDADVRHQFRMLAAIGEQNGKDVNRKQEAPEKQRALLPRPDSRELEKCRQRAVAVLDDVGHGEIVGQEKIGEAAEAQPDEHAYGHAGIARAFDQQRTARNDGRDAATKGIKSAEEGQKQGIRSKQVQLTSPLD